MRIALVVVAVLTAFPAPAAEKSNLPRFASLRAGEVNLRKGPGKEYPVEWVYVRLSLPVEVTAEFGHWRKIRDSERSEGWVHKTLLSRQRSIMVVGDERELFSVPSPHAQVVLRAEAGVLGKLHACQEHWCNVEISHTRGWLPRTHLWGVHPGEVFE